MMAASLRSSVALRARPAARSAPRCAVPGGFVRGSRLVPRAAVESSLSSLDGEPLLELNKDTFWEYLKADEQKGMVIVVDCYTDWCGPCKLILPDLMAYSAELEPNGRIVKFNCNKENKELGVQLKIKVAPTFLIFKDGERVSTMTGAKIDKLKGIVSELLEETVSVPAQ